MRLKPVDASYLLRVLELSPDLRARLEQFQSGGVELSDEDCDELRDLCGERLQIVGFDANYNLTPEGQRLEELIDILFVG